MITKKYEQHNVVLYPYAKEMREVINGDEYKNAAVATAVIFRRWKGTITIHLMKYILFWKAV